MCQRNWVNLDPRYPIRLVFRWGYSGLLLDGGRTGERSGGS